MYRQLAVESEEVGKNFDEYLDVVSEGKLEFVKVLYIKCFYKF